MGEKPEVLDAVLKETVDLVLDLKKIEAFVGSYDYIGLLFVA